VPTEFSASDLPHTLQRYINILQEFRQAKTNVFQLRRNFEHCLPRVKVASNLKWPGPTKENPT
jgi:hypothetical protein